MRKFISTTILGGVFFLIPFVLLVLLLGKVFLIMRTIAEKADLFLPWDSIVGMPIVDVLAVFILIDCCFIAGLVARSGWGRALQNKEGNMPLK